MTEETVPTPQSTLYQHRSHSVLPRNANHIHKDRMTLGSHIADLVAAFVGSWLCVAVHTLWFLLWFTLRLDTGLLTNIVSLEAIFLCTFLMMSQNRQAEKDRIVADETHTAAISEVQETREVITHLSEQDGELLRQTKMLVSLLEKKSGRRASAPVE